MSRILAVWLLPLLLHVLLLSHQALAQAGVSWGVSRSKSVKDNDINCRQPDAQGKIASFCHECGGVAAVSIKCEQNKNCKGFDMEGYQCGYLKTKAGPNVLQGQPGYASFCKRDIGQGCISDYIMYVDYAASPEADYDCNFKKEGKVQPYCQAEGNFNQLMDECDRNVGGRCDGFVISVELNGKSGRLKRGPGGRGKVMSTFVKSEGYIYFIKSSDNKN